MLIGYSNLVLRAPAEEFDPPFPEWSSLHHANFDFARGRQQSEELGHLRYWLPFSKEHYD